MTRPVANVTRICGYDADHIVVRGKDLVRELMGRVTFTEMLLLHALGVKPTRAQVAVLDAVLVTIMEHGLVPSAVVSRLTLYGAPESTQGAIAAGLLGVGDRFAGTASECAQLLGPVVKAPKSKRPSVARELVRRYAADKRPIPGFGHHIHRDQDPRVTRLLEIAREAGAKGDYLAALALLERAIKAELKKPLVTNISGAIAAVLGEAGLPAAIIRGIVLTARCAGLAGHLCEELENPIAGAMWKAAERAVSYEPT